MILLAGQRGSQTRSLRLGRQISSTWRHAHTFHTRTVSTGWHWNTELVEQPGVFACVCVWSFGRITESCTAQLQRSSSENMTVVQGCCSAYQVSCGSSESCKTLEERKRRFISAKRNKLEPPPVTQVSLHSNGPCVAVSKAGNRITRVLVKATACWWFTAERGLRRQEGGPDVRLQLVENKSFHTNTHSVWTFLPRHLLSQFLTSQRSFWRVLPRWWKSHYQNSLTN